jgi:cytidine deaminase
LPQIKGWSKQENWMVLDAQKPLHDQLHQAAIRGMETHFSAGTKSRYGAAVLANNKIYFGGVYSSYDHRLNLHAEMVAAVAAIMDNNRDITHVAVVSNKFTEDVPHLCGCCRQFLAEIEEKTGKPITIMAFSLDGKKCFETKLDTYLPSSWSSGKALEEHG